MGARIVCFLFAAACGVTLLLTFKNRELSAENAELHQRLVTPVLGSWLPDTTLRDIDDLTIDLHGDVRAHRVIHVMDPACGVCEASLPGVRSLQNELKAESQGALLIVSASPEEALRTYRDDHELGGVRFVQSDSKLHSQMGVRVVPTTMVSDSDGRVLAAHVGLLDTNAVNRILTETRSERRRGAVEMPREEGL
ncbi:peroxiredoxin family protein [Luteimonas terrae]|uniref:Peroxiredoxin n=1 Tax=Luteimonas terrae TaxID=1530191 RepID=A0ABU1XSZ3_9GAMM|nr:redoxin domain-containing protein [Luteimonas terrae]MDR7191868.1 peroxiredoxin [Luteimonas terrae]